MKINYTLAALAIVFIWGCSSEKRTLEPGIEGQTLKKLRLEFEEKTLEKVPYLYNFEGLTLAQDDDVTFYRTLGESRLFFPDHIVAQKPNERIATQDLPQLVWQMEDRKVGEFLKKIAPHQHLTLYKQECARAMLSRTNLLEDQSDSAKATIAKYVSMAIQEKLYSPGLMYFALEKLKNTWTPREISNAVQTIIAMHPKFDKSYDKSISEIDAVTPQESYHISSRAGMVEWKRQNKIYVERLKKL